MQFIFRYFANDDKLNYNKVGYMDKLSTSKDQDQVGFAKTNDEPRSGFDVEGNLQNRLLMDCPSNSFQGVVKILIL